MPWNYICNIISSPASQLSSILTMTQWRWPHDLWLANVTLQNHSFLKDGGYTWFCAIIQKPWKRGCPICWISGGKKLKIVLSVIKASQAILNQFHGCILSILYSIFFFQNDIITVSYVILHVCSKTYEIPCFEKKKSHERQQVSSKISALKKQFWVLFCINTKAVWVY